MNEDSFDYKAILQRYVYHWPLFILCLIITITIAFIYLRTATPSYKAQASVLIKGKNNGADALAQLELFQENKVVENETQILSSKSLAEKVVNDLSLNVSYWTDSSLISRPVYKENPIKFYLIEYAKAFCGASLTFKHNGGNTFTLSVNGDEKIQGEFGKIYHSSFGTWKIDNTGIRSRILEFPIKIDLSLPSLTALQMIGNLSITTAGQNSAVVLLAIEDPIPDRAIDILNQLILEYNKAAVEDKNKATQSTLRFVNERLDSLGRELSEAEQNVEHFKSSNGLINISSESQLVLDQAKESDKKLNEIDIQLSVINSIEHYVQHPSEGSSVPSTLGLNDPVLLRLLSTLSDLETKQSAILANGTTSNPMLQPVQVQISSTKKAILESIAVLKQTLVTSKSRVAANLSGIEGSIKSIPKKEREFIGLQRKQSIKDNLVTFLLQKREEAAIASASAVPDSRIVDSAYSLPVQVRPKKAITYALAFFMGLFIPFVWIFTKDIFNSKLNKVSDVDSATNASVIGELANTDDVESLVDFNERSIIAEQFRALRANIKYLYGRKQNSNVTLITSSIPGEGKSFISLNLGLSMALNQRKTVVVEFDLRKPKVASYARIDKRAGLSNYLIGDIKEESLIHQSEIHPNLYVVTAGYIPPNPSELLEEQVLVQLVEYLKLHFQEIILDTPPVGLVSDALLLSKIADASLFVVRLNHTEKAHLEKFNQLYKENKFPKMALVVNGDKATQAYNYAYSYYGGNGGKKPVGKRVKDFMKRF